MTDALLKLLGGRRRVSADALELHMISAYALLQAQAEAKAMADGDEQTQGLYLNACILAKAARKNGRPVFEDGADVLRRLPAQTVERWMARYIEAARQENPSCCDGDHEALKQALSGSGYERLKWRVLRAFGVLPSEARAREMTDADYLYCVLNLTLDGEELLDGLCPDCREQAQQPRCLCCGTVLPEKNTGFDETRFEELKRGGILAGTADKAENAGVGV